MTTVVPFATFCNVVRNETGPTFFVHPISQGEQTELSTESEFWFTL